MPKSGRYYFFASAFLYILGAHPVKRDKSSSCFSGPSVHRPACKFNCNRQSGR